MTRIKKIKTIKNLGIYNNFHWPLGLKDFKRYNVIYGWNGSGKTTLSKLFEATRSGGGHPDYPNLQYTIEDEDSKIINQNQSLGTEIKVFNTCFIADNVNFDNQSSKTISVYLGKENRELIEAIKKDGNLLKTQQEEIVSKEKILEALKKERGEKFTEIARTISQDIRQAIVRNYNRQTAIVKYNQLTETDHIVSEEELNRLRESVSQNIMDVIPEISINTEVFENFNGAIDELLNKTVIAVIISRLKENADISEWVEKGLALHSKYNNDKCEFCGQPITEERINQLLEHFNEADMQIKHDIDNLLKKMRDAHSDISNLRLVDPARFYQEFKNEYVKLKTETETEIQNTLNEIEKLSELILLKKTKTTEKVDNNIGDLDISNLLNAIKKINAIIDSHNEKTSNFSEKVKSDSEKIETHYLCKIRPEVRKIDGQIANLQGEIGILINGDREKNILSIEELKQRIAMSKSKVSPTQKACDVLNDSLHTFLGRNDISFSLNPENNGYNILRHGNLAKNLSEGECTAIAFIYFITTLREKDFNIQESIIVIDDPISSLDANSQFQAFSFLKNTMSDAAQLFLFTHNFDFLKLLLNWLKSAYKKSSAFFMIKNIYQGNGYEREAMLDRLDPVLENFESEYHYLFNVLKNFKSDGTIENVYHIPNIARKLLDNFLMICIPKPMTPYARLKLVDFDDVKKTAIYKFTNDESHITGKGFDPALVPEAQKCIKYLFQMMEATFPDHYKYLMDDNA